MKDNKLIFEINRIGQLMGTNKELPLIVEVNLWFRLLTKTSFSNVDDLIKIFRTRVGPNISAKEIYDLIKELGNMYAMQLFLNSKINEHLERLTALYAIRNSYVANRIIGDVEKARLKAEDGI